MRRRHVPARRVRALPSLDVCCRAVVSLAPCASFQPLTAAPGFAVWPSLELHVDCLCARGSADIGMEG